jgi:hypothetical protein
VNWRRYGRNLRRDSPARCDPGDLELLDSSSFKPAYRALNHVRGEPARALLQAIAHRGHLRRDASPLGASRVCSAIT